MKDIKMHDGCIGYSLNKNFTKEELVKMIEENFPDDNTFENIATYCLNSTQQIFALEDE